MSFLKVLCCCNGEDDDDNQHLIDNDRLNARDPLIISNIPGSDSEINQLNSAIRTREQVEEEVFQKIVKQTQDKVIEVTNYEKYNGNVDVAERAARYQTAVARHDENHGVHLPPSTLLADSGLDILDCMQRPELIGDDIKVLLNWNKTCTNSVKMGLQIEKKEDIVVYMRNDENI
uniref:Late embryogenesis abundant protein n=2 Tax=Panagrolaimus sp. JU765 TaxID=591449 RepID=A0AC34R5I2_9BILA